MPKVKTAKKGIVFTSAFIAFWHAIMSVAKYIFVYQKYIGEFIEQIAVDLLLLCVLCWIYCELKDAENKTIVIKKLISRLFCKEQVLLSIVFLMLCISVISHISSEGNVIIQLNKQYIIDLFICTYIVFPLGRYACRVRIPKLVWILIDVSLFMLSGYMVYIIVHVFQNKMVPTVMNGAIGMIERNYTLQLGINCHPNTVGAYSGLIFLTCVSLAVFNKGFRRCLYCVETIIHFMILALSNSRGSFLAVLCAMFVMVAVITYYTVKKEGICKKFVLSLIVGALVCIILYVARDTVFKAYDSTRVTHEEYAEVIRDINVASSNGRTEIWKQTGILMFESLHNMLFGVTPYWIDKILSERLQWENDVYTHNQLLEVAADIGIPALFTFGAFLIILGIRCLKIGFARAEDANWKQKTIPVIVLFLVIANVMEATLLFYGYLSGCIFMLLSGWITQKELT